MHFSGYEPLSQYLHMPWVLAIPATLAVVIAVLLLVRYRRKSSDVRCLKRVLKKGGYACKQDVVLPDGVDGYLFVDYLILLRGKIVVMNVESRSGYIFGGETIDEWTCVKNNRTGKFNNPLDKVTLFAQQVKHLFGFNAVDACVLFGSDSEFPKGVPQGVLQMADFAESLDALGGNAEEHEAAEQVWERLIAMTNEGRHQLDVALQP